MVQTVRGSKQEKKIIKTKERNEKCTNEHRATQLGWVPLQLEWCSYRKMQRKEDAMCRWAHREETAM